MTQPPQEKYPDLEPGIRAFMIAGERFYPPDAVNFTLAEQRAFYDRYAAHFRKPRPSGVSTSDFATGSIPCRLYQKAGTVNPPILLYLHGGGYVLGGLESHDDICAEICDGAAVDVVSIHYRLAPEHPFPAAFEETLAVYRNLTGQYRRLLIGGDSAGGNLAAAACLKLRDEGAIMPAGHCAKRISPACRLPSWLPPASILSMTTVPITPATCSPPGLRQRCATNHSWSIAFSGPGT